MPWHMLGGEMTPSCICLGNCHLVLLALEYASKLRNMLMKVLFWLGTLLSERC